MILSHQRRYAFIKNKKVAGTSMELFLSQFTGETDVITPIGEEPELIPVKLQPLFGREKRFQNYAGYFNHVSGAVVRDRIGHELWDAYFTFCFERPPISKLTSMFHFKTSDISEAGDPHADFMDMAYPNFSSDAFNYFDHGRVITSKIANFANLSNEMAEICEQIGVPFGGDLGFRSKGQHKKIQTAEFNLTDQVTQEIVDAYALEAELLPFMGIDQRHPSSPAALPWCMARAARENGRLSDAETHIKEALQRDPEFIPARREDALIDWRLDKRKRALSKIENVIADAPGRCRFIRDAANMNWSFGRHKKAKETIQFAINQSPKNPRLYAQLARWQAKNGAFEAAAATMTKSMEYLRTGTPAWMHGHIRNMAWQKEFGEVTRYISNQLVLHTEVEEFSIPDGRISYLKELDFKKVVAEEALKEGDLSLASTLLIDVRYVQHDGGLAFIPLVRAIAKIEDKTLAANIITQILDLQPTSPRLLAQLINVIRRTRSFDLTSKLSKLLSAHCPERTDLTDKLQALAALNRPRVVNNK